MQLPSATATAFTLLGLASALAGCRDEVLDDQPPAVSAGSHGLFVLTHAHGEPGVQVSGQVLAWEGLGEPEARNPGLDPALGGAPAAALHAVVLPEQAWLAAAPPALDTCRVVSVHRGLPPDARIDLLDAGEVFIHPPAPLADTALRLAPRDLPPMLLRMAGVVYDADAPQALPYLAGGRYQVRAEGAETAPLAASVEAPPAVWLEGAVFDAAGLTVRWGGAATARVFLSRDVGAHTLGIECAGAEGALQVPAAILSALGAGPAELSVSSSRRSGWSAPGVGSGLLLFVARDGREVQVPALAGQAGAGGGPSPAIESNSEMREEALP